MPLILTSYSSLPVATGFGIGLMLALAGLSTTTADGVDEELRVAAARATKVATSWGNRVVRVSKGFVAQ